MLSLILFCVACGVCAAWMCQRKPMKETEPPVLPDALPIIGHAPLFTLDNVQIWELMELLARLSLEDGGVVTMLLGPRSTYVLTDPEDSLTAANACLGKSEFYRFAKEWVGEGLISASVPTWKSHRKLINPAFSQQVLDGFLGVFNSQAKRLADSFEDQTGKGSFDPSPYLLINGLETICLTAMGLEISGEDYKHLNKQYFVALEEMFEILIERISKIWLYSDHIYRWTKLKRRQDELVKILHNMSNKVLQQRKIELKENDNVDYKYTDYVGSKFKPFLDRMLELANDEGVFSDQEIREHVDTMIVTGHDTSATSLIYTLVLLGSHPDVQEKLYNELQDVLGSDRDMEKQDISKLTYMEAVIKESVRLFPIFPLVTRHVDKDVKLKNYTLSAGGICIIMLYGIHRHSMWGPDAEEFRPERWLDPGAMPATPAAFAGFSLGKRGCIGKTYSMMSMKTSLAHVIRRYRVTGDHSKLKLKLGVMLKPVTGHHIAIERRE